MQRESTLARGLWIGMLVLLCAYIAVDLLSSPFEGGDSGRAAVRPPEVTLWVPAPEAGGETMVVARQAAAGLELRGHPSVVKRLKGGSSPSIARMLTSRPGGPGDDLLVISSSTLAEIAHDRYETLVPGAAEQSLVARQLLLRSRPLALLSADPLLLGVPRGSAITNTHGFLAALRRHPSRRLIAIGEDAFSRAQLASLLKRAGISGDVRFDVRESGPVAAEATQEGAAGSVLTPRGTVLGDVRSGRLHRLEWPLGGGRPPRDWVAVVAPPRLGAAAGARAGRWLQALARDPHWRAAQHRQGRQTPRLRRRQLTDFLAVGIVHAERQERLSRRIERGCTVTRC
jgi:tripartite-type tricarboxylate transporter receptor subunit TctC